MASQSQTASPEVVASTQFFVGKSIAAAAKASLAEVKSAADWLFGGTVAIAAFLLSTDAKLPGTTISEPTYLALALLAVLLGVHVVFKIWSARILGYLSGIVANRDLEPPDGLDAVTAEETIRGAQVLWRTGRLDMILSDIRSKNFAGEPQRLSKASQKLELLFLFEAALAGFAIILLYTSR